MTQEYKHFRRKLEFIQYLISEKGAAIDLNKTMRLPDGWFVDESGTEHKALHGVDFLTQLNDKYNLGFDIDKSVIRGYHTYIIFDKEQETEVPVKEEIVTEDTVETTEEVKTTKRKSRKSVEE